MDGALTELAGTAWAAAGEEELLAAARNIEGWSRRLYGVALAVTAELDNRGVACSRGLPGPPLATGCQSTEKPVGRPGRAVAASSSGPPR